VLQKTGGEYYRKEIKSFIQKGSQESMGKTPKEVRKKRDKRVNP